MLFVAVCDIHETMSVTVCGGGGWTRGLRFRKLPGTEPGTGTAVPVPVPNHFKTVVPVRFQNYYTEPWNRLPIKVWL